MRNLIILLGLLIPIACNPASGGDNNGNGGELSPNLINGKEVPTADWPFVVRIKTGNAGCTATVVGPRTVITAAHCGSNGATSSMVVAGQTFTGKVYRSPIYPRQDHDVAVILLSKPMPKEVVGRYVHVGGTNTTGQDRLLMGYGCTRAGGGGGNDGKLRAGYTPLTGNSGYDIVSGKEGEAALCFGDSGGPMFDDTSDRGNMNPDVVKLLAVNSKGNIRNRNYNASLVNGESQRFLKAFGEQHSVEICGINGTWETCDGDEPTPPNPPNPPTPPTPPTPPNPSQCTEKVKRDIITALETCLELDW